MSEANRVVQIFSDESGWEGDNRYGSLAKIVGEKPIPQQLNSELGEVLKRYEIADFKFKRINSWRKVQAAKELIEILMRFVCAGEIGVYVLVWDKQDTRHNIQGRCDLSNLCRMYYHNLKSIKKQWKVECSWEFFPDEFSAIDWQEDIINFLTNRKLASVVAAEPDLFDFYSNLKVSYTKVKELKSVEYPLLQLADLLAGLCRTSRQEFSLYKGWSLAKSKQASIFDTPEAPLISKTLEYKFQVKQFFKSQCDKYRLGVNISRNGYLQTFKPSNRLSIWHYEPQGSYDKAPVRDSL